MADTRLGLSDSGQSLDVSPGQAIVIELDENRGTGYSWQVADAASECLELAESSYLASHEQRLGAGGTRRLRFVAKAKGSGVIDLRLRRPWESAKPAVKHFHVHVNVS